MAKYQEICEILSERIENGDYAGGRIPPLRKLAEDMGVSYLTARQAVNLLKEKGVVGASSSGRSVHVNGSGTVHPLVALITPFWHFSEWHATINEKVKECGGLLRIFAFATETDPIINEALNEEFDLIFIELPANPNARLLERVAKLKKKAVVMFQDRTDYGIRSVLGAPVESISLFMKKLKGAGAKRIDMITPEPENNFNLNERRNVWQKALKTYHLTGICHTYQAQRFKHNQITAKQLCSELLENPSLPDAIFCAGHDIAIGLYRACYEKGIRIGRDVSVFCFGADNDCKLMAPALATVVNHGVAELLEQIIRQYCPGNQITDQLLYQLETMEIFEGESLNIEKRSDQ